MKKELFFAAFVAALLVVSCIDMGERVNGSGNIKSENRDISKAEKIKVTGDMDVFITQGPAALRVEGDDNVLAYIETVANDGWLEIRPRDHANINTSKPVKAYITTPDLSDLKITGSGNITCNQKFSTSNNMSFSITGSGDITAEINAPKVKVHITGSGNLHISGETKEAEIHISGSGNYDGPRLKAENAEVTVAGSGDADLFADAHLKASIAGSGNVKYKGNATVDSHVAGSGAVTKAE